MTNKLDQMICDDGESHIIKYAEPKELLGRSNFDKDIVCRKCNRILKKYKWNGKYLDIIDMEE